MAKRYIILLCRSDARRLAQLRRELRLIVDASIYSCLSGLEAVRAISTYRPDFAFLDLALPGLDALGVLDRMGALNLPRRPRVVVIAEPGQQRAAQRALELGACLAVDGRELEAGRLGALMRRAEAAPERLPPGAERRLHALMLELGVPRRLDGFNYISQAVLLALAEPYLLNNFSKYLYPAVARRYNTTKGCVERSIRHAIEAAWAHIPLDVLQREFGNTIDSERGKPTNAEFIARLADKLRHGGEYLPGGDCDSQI